MEKQIFYLFILFVLSACGGEGDNNANKNESQSGENKAPVFTSPATANQAENQTGVVYRAKATGAKSYTLSGIDGEHFLLDEKSGEIVFLAAPNYEQPNDANQDNVYAIQLTAVNGALTTKLDIAISVVDANDPPEIITTAAQRLHEGADAYQFIAVFDEDNDALTYRIVGGEDADVLAIDTQTSAILFDPAADFEAPLDAGKDNTYSIEVGVSDGTTEVTQVFTITILDELLLNAMITFPTPEANIGGDATSITVTGVLVDEEDNSQALEEIDLLVNNEPVIITEGETQSTWSLQMPVDAAEKRGTLTLEVMKDGRRWLNTSQSYANNDLREVGVGGGEGFRYPRQVVMNDDSSHLYVIDQPENKPSPYAIVKVDLSTGDRSIISSPVNEPYPADDAEPRKMHFDKLEERLIVLNVDSKDWYVIDIQLGDGSRSLLFSNDNITGAEIVGPTDFIFDEAKSRMYFNSRTAIMELNTLTGESRVLSSNERGTGTDLHRPYSMAADLESGRLWVFSLHPEPDDWSVLAIDIDSGNRSLVANKDRGEGLSLSSTMRLRYDFHKDHVIALGLNRSILAIDPDEGHRKTIMLDNNTDIVNPIDLLAIALDPVHNRAFLTDHHAIKPRILLVDFLSGSKAIASQ